MAQTVFFPPSMPHVPASPDPTRLRMLAFSVAEAALQSDPASPSFESIKAIGTRSHIARVIPTTLEDTFSDADLEWSQPRPRMDVTQDSGRGERQRMLSIVEKAKARRERDTLPLNPGSIPLPRSQPVSPASYNFVLPPNSPLAQSIVSTPQRPSPSQFKPRRDIPTPPHLLSRGQKSNTPTPTSTATRQPPPKVTVTPPKAFPKYVRSVEPSPSRPFFDGISPTSSTFAGLDRSRPPPEFTPRLSAKELAARLRIGESRVQPAQQDDRHVNRDAEVISNDHKTLSRLPSLAQIQAKVAATDTSPPRRSSFASLRSTAAMQANSKGPIDPGLVNRRPRISLCMPLPRRTDSQGSVEFLQTPTDGPSPGPRIVFAPGLTERRSPTPPSPTIHMSKGNFEALVQELGLGKPRAGSPVQGNVETETSPLGAFLRERTSGRLANRNTRPTSMPPLAADFKLDLSATHTSGGTRALGRFQQSRSTTTSPIRPFHNLPDPASFTRRASTPPMPSRAFGSEQSLTLDVVSPTNSTRSIRSNDSGKSGRSNKSSRSNSSSSPLDLPMITCTPAPDRQVDPVGEENRASAEVVLFEGFEDESEDEDEVESTEEERGKRGREMLAMLGLRRRSD